MPLDGFDIDYASIILNSSTYDYMMELRTFAYLQRLRKHTGIFALRWYGYPVCRWRPDQGEHVENDMNICWNCVRLQCQLTIENVMRA